MWPIERDCRKQFRHLGCHSPCNATAEAKSGHAHSGSIRERFSLKITPAALEIFHKLIGWNVAQFAGHVSLPHGGAPALARKQVDSQTHITRFCKPPRYILDVRRESAVFMAHQYDWRYALGRRSG